MSSTTEIIEDALDVPFNDVDSDKMAIDTRDENATAESSKVEKEDYGIDEVKKRNKILTKLLQEFYTDYRITLNDTRKKRSVFYIIAIIILCLVLAANIAMIIAVTFTNIAFNVLIALYVYATLTSVTSIMTIPIIIAKHLFPVERDARIVEMLKSVITNDCQIRELKQHSDEHRSSDLDDDWEYI